jgi:glutathione synthase/RimK-type ligase-like ATP-grasp enzyme
MLANSSVDKPERSILQCTLRDKAQVKADVALLTERRYVSATAPAGDWYLENILRDDHLLQAALNQLGLSSVRVDWSQPDHDWSEFRCAVFRTTWDYFNRFEEFNAWFGRVQSLTRMCNEPSVIKWNMDKHYLADLQARGISVVPSRFVERGTKVRLRELLEQTGWHDAVIKPCVSGGARHTYRVGRKNAEQVDVVVQRLLAVESLILQPFQQAIVARGEDSLMLFNGRFSHAVRKVAKPGDFRVQDDHGGSVHTCLPTPPQIDLAERAMVACDPMPAYGRVDMLQDDQGHWMVMEMELIEPELWLRYHPPAATALAQAIAESL